MRLGLLRGAHTLDVRWLFAHRHPPVIALARLVLGLRTRYELRDERAERVRALSVCLTQFFGELVQGVRELVGLGPPAAAHLARL